MRTRREVYKLEVNKVLQRARIDQRAARAQGTYSGSTRHKSQRHVVVLSEKNNDNSYTPDICSS